MTTDMRQVSSVGARAGTIVGCLTAVWLMSVVAAVTHSIFPRSLISALFFAPQYVFPFGSVYRQARAEALGGPPVGSWISVALWLTVIGVFTWVTRPLRFPWLLIAALVTVLLVTAAIHALLPMFGFSLRLEGL